MFTTENKKFMRLAIDLAAKGEGKTSPNPMVGAVIVKNGHIIGKGFHHKAGTPHAEVHALNEAGHNAINADLYVNLEPCSHQGKTPACAKRIIKEKISRVFISIPDPNPLINGHGIAMLKEAGIKVYTGLLTEEAARLNRKFFKFITTGLPFITLKTATTLDGKTCSVTGESRWISNPLSREFVHQQRSITDAVITGIGTVIKDNPSLTCRLPGNDVLYPYRVILDSKLQIPLSSKILSDPHPDKVIIATTQKSDKSKLKELEKKGICIITCGKESIELTELLRFLASMPFTSLLLESGGTLNASFVEAGLIDEIFLFIAPKILGGKNAPTFIEGTGISELKNAYPFKLLEIKQFNEDVLLHYERKKTCSQE